MFKVFPDILDAARLPDSSDQIPVDRSRFLLEYVSAFTSELQTITWSPRSRSFKKWEKSLDITLKKKKNYRKHTTTVSGRASSSTTTLPSAVARKRRSQYTRYYHNKVLPYFKHTVNFDVSACITLDDLPHNT
ncbi:hypothetical protein RIR_jg35575.t1 [Rhizophagus irregularis DAOM 181602=DAOM 197198]|nr:hypothetical protein RIR_jg35575.t1 [Rhizophagus irregularis DAOM 181602=DAOM 197198]